MKKSALLSLFVLSLIGFSVSAEAKTAIADIDAHVSTLGIGMDLSSAVTDTIDARIGFSQFKKSFNQSTSSNGGQANYSGNLKLSSVDLLADWHLFNGVTHLTTGAMYNGNKLEMNAVGTYVINGTSYNTPLTTTVAFNKFAPYLGFGWSGRARNTGWSFKSDFGILFQGAPKTTITAPGVSAADIASEEKTINDSLKNFKYYPVISIGIGYAF